MNVGKSGLEIIKATHWQEYIINFVTTIIVLVSRIYASPLHLGNLCRCTGYRPILEGYKTFAKVCISGLIQFFF